MPGDEDDIDPGPFFVRPDAEKAFWVQPKIERLVRRGPREYFLVARAPDGREVATRLTSATISMGNPLGVSPIETPAS